MLASYTTRNNNRGGQGSSVGKGTWPPRLTPEFNLWNQQAEGKNPLPRAVAPVLTHTQTQIHIQIKKYLKYIENDVNAFLIICLLSDLNTEKCVTVGQPTGADWAQAEARIMLLSGPYISDCPALPPQAMVTSGPGMLPRAILDPWFYQSWDLC